MSQQYRLVELPPDAFSASASSELHPTRHLAAHLAAAGYIADVRDVALGYFDFAIFTSAVKEWLRQQGLPGDVSLVEMPKAERKVPRRYALVPVQPESAVVP
jgi:hypothetical protein